MMENRNFFHSFRPFHGNLDLSGPDQYDFFCVFYRKYENLCFNILQ
ncbi:hypothetical protein SXCC_02285 [Gluconacetobacter sp. SXCC-1]|nr:hypothetical protein SXCC_02285 [Gluconacetobacter sp. SXCC-1]